MNKKIKNIARLGLLAKAITYAIIGVLTFMAALNIGGQKASKLKVLEFLEKQTFGAILLVILGIGLFCYALWCFIQALKDPESIGKDTKAILLRIGTFITGLIYSSLGVIAFINAFGSFSPSGNSGGESSSFLATNLGLILIGIAGAIVTVLGIYQFTKINEDSFEKDFSRKSIREKKRKKTIYSTAYVGLTARGIILVIIGYFALTAAFTANPSKVKSTTEVFAFLEQSSYGNWLLGTVAIGLIAFSLYTFMLSKYRRFS